MKYTLPGLTLVRNIYHVVEGMAVAGICKGIHKSFNTVSDAGIAQ